jgi:hypothetical protein
LVSDWSSDVCSSDLKSGLYFGAFDVLYSLVCLFVGSKKDKRRWRW